ncbi:MAG TPA: glycosyltransferase [Anaerolineales bacterium]|jgi:UDP-N-acetylglucosamine transferase subunit ALG13
MIFVTVGTPQQPFDRLVKAVDDFAVQANEIMLIQAGTTTYTPKHAEYFRWATFKEMEKFTQESRIVISQASAGAIILALKFGKPLIIVPRLSKYGEHYNDHQYQLALALQKGGQAVVLAESLTLASLQNAIDRAPKQGGVQSSRENLVNGLRRQLDAWQGQIKPNERVRE